MSDVPALEKHACPACGAQAEWNPTKQKLVCPFCGTESAYAIDRDAGKVGEKDLAGALRERGFIYRDYYMVNWDPGTQSAISDLEVVSREVEDTMYSIAYPIEGSDEALTVADRHTTSG